MPNYTAADVKLLREETDAPMMECKTALDEADGDLTRAKEILREKGKMAAQKRVGRSTAAGVVAFSTKDEGTTIGGVLLECETDFVARNEEFILLAQQVADMVRDEVAESKIHDATEGAVAKIRENIRVAKSVRFSGGGKFLTYVHHDKTKGAAIEATGEAHDEELRKLAIQVVAFPPEVLKKEDLSQEKLASEFEIQKKRALEEGKPEAVAENIAKGRINKEFIKSVVLFEQPFYTDPAKSVAQYIAESAKGSEVKSFVYLAVGPG
jgi:elongation factor Ts